MVTTIDLKDVSPLIQKGFFSSIWIKSETSEESLEQSPVAHTQPFYPKIFVPFVVLKVSFSLQTHVHFY